MSVFQISFSYQKKYSFTIASAMCYRLQKCLFSFKLMLDSLKLYGIKLYSSCNYPSKHIMFKSLTSFKVTLKDGYV